jgi:hypothetical protein
MKIRPVGAELFYVDRRMDRTDEVNSRFSQFCEKRLKTIRRNSLSCGQQIISAQAWVENCTYPTAQCSSNNDVSSLYMRVRRSYKPEGPGFNSGRGKIFFLPQNTVLALRPPQPPIQWVPVVFTLFIPTST